MPKLRCEYCRRLRTNDEPCLGCGQTEIARVQDQHKYEFFHKGYFVKVLQYLSGLNDIEFFFFRGEKLIEHLKVDFRTFMHLREAHGVSDGEDDFYLIWEMFEETQKGKFGVVKTYENDPKYKRIDARVIPWGYEICNAMIKVNDNLRTLCRVHEGALA